MAFIQFEPLISVHYTDGWSITRESLPVRKGSQTENNDGDPGPSRRHKRKAEDDGLEEEEEEGSHASIPSKLSMLYCNLTCF